MTYGAYPVMLMIIKMVIEKSGNGGGVQVRQQNQIPRDEQHRREAQLLPKLRPAGSGPWGAHRIAAADPAGFGYATLPSSPRRIRTMVAGRAATFL